MESEAAYYFTQMVSMWLSFVCVISLIEGSVDKGASPLPFTTF